MFADSVEAAVRSMQDKDTQKIRNAVEEIMNLKIQDGQLIESQLTYAEYYAIQESFIFTLDSLYHSRITYPVGKIEEKKVFKKNYSHKRGHV